MDHIYDEIGKNYSIGRRTDPAIASEIYSFLEGAESIVNIGAGTGSYELPGKKLVAVEPSIEMISQRPKGSYDVRQSSAESLPFQNGEFSHAMAVLSMHHWKNRYSAFEEIKRVITKRFIAITWDPKSEPYWLTKKYFPEIHQIDQSIFPSITELTKAFSGIKVYPLLIPSNCIDGFTAAYWARPQAYLDPKVRSNMSTFSRIKKLNAGLQMLTDDLKSGSWHSQFKDLIHLDKLDVGYRLVVWDV